MRRARLALLLVVGLLAWPAEAGGSLRIPVSDAFGDPIDVGLLIVGHSTSALGEYPDKLVGTLNNDPNDGRNYVAHRVITFGDGGFLWSALSFPPEHLQYDRVKASSSDQWCQDLSGVRWSCRRLRIERGLTGGEPAPPECAPPENGCTPDRIDSCVWHEGGERFEETDVDFKTCWDRMDVRLALVQDTSNRSFAIDDNTGDGTVDESDYFLASDVTEGGRPCGGGSGVIDEWIDWNCDGSLDEQDAAHLRYADWLFDLAVDLLDGFGSAGVDHVFLTHKPIEVFGCEYFSGEPCSNHGIRDPTPSRPFDHYYLPTVYWEYRPLEALFSRADLDTRIHPATPLDVLEMWDSSAHCYADGIASDEWSIPLSAGRPESIDADDSEVDPFGAEFVGCLGFDHIHQNNSGGWQMADVWYAGLRPYLHDVTLPPSGASESDLGMTNMLVTGYDHGSGTVTLEYEAACRAVDHVLHAGPLEQVGAYAYDLSRCGLGTTGETEVDVGPGNRFWVLAGRDGYREGSLGRSSSGAERAAPAAAGPCYLPQHLGGPCP